MKATIQKGTENKMYTIGICAIAILFAVFFTSKMWLYDDTAIAQTPFDSEITGLSQTTLQLSKWEYNPERALMEVTIEIKHTGDDIIKPTFTFKAVDRDSKEKYPVKIVYNEDDEIVLQILNIDEKYNFIGLIVQENRDEKVLTDELKEEAMKNDEGVEQNNNDEIEVDLSSVEPDERVIVGDYRKIKTNVKLATKETVDYQVDSVKREINDVEKEIKSIIKDKIPLQEDLIATVEIDIAKLENDIEYQTDDEKEDTLSLIESHKSAIKKAQEDKEEYKESLQKLVDKREKLTEKLEAIESKSDGGNKEKASSDEESVDDENTKDDKSDDNKNVNKDEEKEKSKKQKDKKKDKKEKKKDKDKKKKEDK